MLLEHRFPKISCLMITAGGRFEYFKRSFRCYVDQTYPNKELLIVNDGPLEYQKQILDWVGNRLDVRPIFLKGRFKLGALRNISIALAHGEVFVQWDDDDFNAPNRLMVQFNWMNRQSCSICYLADQLHYFFPLRQLYWEHWLRWCGGGLIEFSLIPGTIMAVKKDFVFAYPSAGKNCSAGEDSVLAHDICQKFTPTLLAEAGHLNVYSFHGRNVWDLEHHLMLAKHRSKPVAEMLHNRMQIVWTLNYLKLDSEVQVMGREGLAFIHKCE